MKLLSERKWKNSANQGCRIPRKRRDKKRRGIIENVSDWVFYLDDRSTIDSKRNAYYHKDRTLRREGRNSMFSHIPLMACSKINDAGSTIGGFFAVQIHGKSLRGHRLDRVMAPPRALHYLFTGGTCALAWCTRPSSSRVHGEPAMALWPTSLRNNGPILAVFAIFEELKC